MKSLHLRQVQKLLKMFESGEIPRLQQHEVNPELPKSSRENYLYFTLPVAINFQRNSPAMWRSALATYNDPATQYVFYPEQSTKKSVLQVQKSLVKHGLALQRNKHTHIWTTISRTLHESFQDDPREVIKATEFDVLKLIELLQVTRKTEFPYLSGPKLSNYWPFILSHFTDVQWKNSHEISIIPDTHVIQSTIQLGMVPANASSQEVAGVWKKLLDGSDIQSTSMHSVLWHWSRNNFEPALKT